MVGATNSRCLPLPQPAGAAKTSTAEVARPRRRRKERLVGNEQSPQAIRSESEGAV